MYRQLCALLPLTSKPRRVLMARPRLSLKFTLSNGTTVDNKLFNRSCWGVSPLPLATAPAARGTADGGGGLDGGGGVGSCGNAKDAASCSCVYRIGARGVDEGDFDLAGDLLTVAAAAVLAATELALADVPTLDVLGTV